MQTIAYFTDRLLSTMLFLALSPLILLGLLEAHRQGEFDVALKDLIEAIKRAYREGNFF